MKEFIEKLIGRLEEVSIPIFDKDTEMESKVIFTDIAKNIVNQLAEEYEYAEEQGLLIKLPCKVGDTVYYPEEEINYIYPVKISKIIVLDSEIVQYDGCFFDCYGDPSVEFEFDYADFGKTVFLTKEEAEQALAEMKGV